MAVYVDSMRARYRPPHRPGIVYVMCHMAADTNDELHAMADKIGVARKWFQGDHYDVTLAMRAKAVKAGAREVTWKQLALMMANKRDVGGGLGDPATAHEVYLKRRAQAIPPIAQHSRG